MIGNFSKHIIPTSIKMMIFLFLISIPIFGICQDSPNPNYISIEKYFDSKIKSLDEKIAERYPSRTEYIDKLNEMQKDILALREYKALMDGKASQTSVDRSLLISVLSMIMSILNLLAGILLYVFSKKRKE